MYTIAYGNGIEEEVSRKTAKRIIDNAGYMNNSYAVLADRTLVFFDRRKTIWEPEPVAVEIDGEWHYIPKTFRSLTIHFTGGY